MAFGVWEHCCSCHSWTSHVIYYQNKDCWYFQLENTTDKRQVQSFLGFCNFYHWFIEGYSEIVCPLTHLTGNEPWLWGSKQQEAFKQVKTLITSTPILTIPTDNDPFHVKADASEFAIGAVLSQKQNGLWKLITYLSKALNPTECNYEVYNWEMLTIMIALSQTATKTQSPSSSMALGTHKLSFYPPLHT